MGMHLNILNLMEMIDVAAAEKGIVQSLINQGKEIGLDNGKREIISSLLSSHSLDEVAEFFDMSKQDIIEILEKTGFFPAYIFF